MKRLAVLAIMAGAGCAKSSPPPAVIPEPVQVVDQSLLNPAAIARADSGRPPFTAADVKFMQGMIHHHAQAILMGKWSSARGASDAVKLLSERIVVSQRDEIAMMATWLRDRKLEVPTVDTLGAMASHAHMGHEMAGMPKPVMMPGMLTADQIAKLDSARGRAYDRLFLQYMIQHHQGAITMVKELLSSPGAAHDNDIYRFAADVEADQNAEIDRMTRMLESIPPAVSQDHET